MLLLLVGGVLSACGSSKAAIDIPDEALAKLEEVYSPQEHAFYVMKEAAPETAADVQGRDWVICSPYTGREHLLSQIQFFQIAHAEGIWREEPETLLLDCMEIINNEPQSILVIDSDLQSRLRSEMVEVVFE